MSTNRSRLVAVLSIVSLCLVVNASAIVTPDVWIPFENDNGDPLDTTNPAWSNAMVGDTVPWISPGTPPTYPQITSNGLKGDAWWGTDPAMIGQTTRTHNWTTGSVFDAMNSVQSYTITGWLRTADETANGSESYIMGQKVPIKWRGDGRLQALDGGAWHYANWGDGYSNGDWVFFAIVRDSTSLTFYHGDTATPVYMGASTTGTYGLTNASRVTLGGYTYNGSDLYCGYDMDELRMYSALDNSGALSMADLEAIRQYDLVPEPATMGLLALGVGFVLRRKRK